MIEDINITIGSDPEFIILCGEYIEVAGEIFTQISHHQFCDECDVCSNCEECEFETHINYEDIENITLVVKNTIDQEIDKIKYIVTRGIATLYYTEEYIYTNKYVYVLPYLDIEKLKQYIINDIIKENYDREFIQRREHKEEILRRSFIYPNDIEKLEKEYFEQKFIYLTEQQRETIAYYFRYGLKPIGKIIDDIYNKIEIREEEPTCKYDIAACGVCENCQVCKEKLTEAETVIGCDEDIAIGELRPISTSEPLRHFEEIKLLIDSLFDMLSSYGVCGHNSNMLSPDNLYQIKAGGFYKYGYQNYSLGGHIHIGYPKRFLDYTYLEEKKKIDNELGKYLSYFTGILLKRLESVYDIEGRERRNIGFFNDWKEKDYGLEWRMPASWLIDPEICIGALCLTYVVAYEFWWLYFNNGNKLEKDINTINEEMFVERVLLPETVNSERYDLYVKSSYIDYRTRIDYIIGTVAEMRLYDRYSKYIEHIFGMIIDNKKWNSDMNIFTSWIQHDKLEKAIVTIGI